MNQTYIDVKGNIYSVDMMFVYIHDKKPKAVEVTVGDDILNNKCWITDDKKQTHYAPADVLKNPKKYKSDHDRINNADLKYPIIINDKGAIIDGMHRATKAILDKKFKIKAYIIDKDLLKKFLIGNTDKSAKFDNLCIWNYIEQYKKRFGNESIKKNNNS
jgi:hypothetical protein